MRRYKFYGMALAVLVARPGGRLVRRRREQHGVPREPDDRLRGEPRRLDGRDRRRSAATSRRTATTLFYELTYSGLEGTVQQAHIHFGKRAINGGVSVFLCANGDVPDWAAGGSARVPAVRHGRRRCGHDRRHRPGRPGDRGGEPRRAARGDRGRPHVRQRPFDEVAGRRDPRADRQPRGPGFGR